MTRRAQRGYTYVEMLATLFLVGVAILTSAGLLLHCRERAIRIEVRAHAVHAAATEMDHLLATVHAGLQHGDRHDPQLRRISGQGLHQDPPGLGVIAHDRPQGIGRDQGLALVVTRPARELTLEGIHGPGGSLADAGENAAGREPRLHQG